eukprot:3824332-Rhodomonas_salina.2
MLPRICARGCRHTLELPPALSARHRRCPLRAHDSRRCAQVDGGVQFEYDLHNLGSFHGFFWLDSDNTRDAEVVVDALRDAAPGVSGADQRERLSAQSLQAGGHLVPLARSQQPDAH